MRKNGLCYGGGQIDSIHTIFEVATSGKVFNRTVGKFVLRFMGDGQLHGSFLSPGNRAFGYPYLRRFVRGKSMVYFLTYHSISKSSPAIPEALGLCVSPERFAAHMRLIRRFFCPISLQFAEDMLSGKKRTIANAVAVSFDDGYRDNLTAALPILEQYRIPATIFVITGLIGTNKRPWNIQLYHDLHRTQAQEIHLPDEFDGLDRIFTLQTPYQKYTAMIGLRSVLKSMQWESLQRALTEIRSQLKLKGSEAESDHLRMLDWDDMAVLQQKGIRFGSHTVHHMILENEHDKIVRREVVESKKVLESRLQSPVKAFAYPGNAGKGFSERTKCLIRQAGYQSCYLFSTGTGFNTVGSDLHALNRSEVLGSAYHLGVELSGLRDLLRVTKHRVRLVVSNLFRPS